MSVTMRRAMLMACLLASSLPWPSASWALGLGEIHLNSALNEPMNAEIDLLAATPDDMAALRANLASRDAFTRYGIDKPPFLASFTFTVGKSKDGRDVLQVRSADAIPEPFVTFLVDVNWAQGHLLREYTVLLDPPAYTPGARTSPSVPVTAPSTAATAPPVPTPGPVPTPAPAPATTAAPLATSPGRRAAPPATAADGANGISVGKGDTLIKIAQGLDSGSPSPADLDQTMIALYRSNPSAFSGNINLLHEGAILRVPGADQIAAVNRREAIDEVHRQMEAWRSSATAAGAPGGHLRLVPPTAGGSATGAGNSGAANSNAPAAEGVGSASRRVETFDRYSQWRTRRAAAEAGCGCRSAAACRRDTGAARGRKSAGGGESADNSQSAGSRESAGLGQSAGGRPARGHAAVAGRGTAACAGYRDQGARRRGNRTGGPGQAGSARRQRIVARLGGRELVDTVGLAGSGLGCARRRRHAPPPSRPGR
jgi:FimV-like protein